MKMKWIQVAIMFAFLLAMGPFSWSAEAESVPLSTADAGIIGVEIWQPDGWQKVGDASFSLAHQQQRMSLPVLAAQSDSIRLRLTQSGGKAAYMDALFLNGEPPKTLSGLNSPKAYAKLIKKDHDLLDITGGQFEAEFTRTGSDLNLDLTAKIVPPKISPLPLRYPQVNSRLPLGQARFFYKITPTPQISKDFQELMTTSPAIRELSNTGSGHPGGILWGWVEKDSQNLLVTVDFTQDNTEDGDDDYMELYVKTPQGVKSFRITQSQNQYGKVHFTKTPHAAYEHKIYRFTLPLAELSLTPNEPVELALAAYGTVSVALMTPSVAFDSVHRRYLLVYSAYNLDDSNIEIRGLFVDVDGRALGPEFVINNEERPSSNVSVRVGFHPRNKTYFIVWDEELPDEDRISIQVQIIDANGNTLSPRRKILASENHQLYPELAYGRRTNGFLLVWNEFTDFGSDYKIHGMILNGDGQSVVSSESLLTGSLDEQVLPQVCADDNHGRFLVTYTDYLDTAPGVVSARGGAGRPVAQVPYAPHYDVLGQLVSAGGQLIGSAVPLAATERVELVPKAVFNPYENQYFLVWLETVDVPDYLLEELSLKTRLFDDNLTPVGTIKTLGETSIFFADRPFSVSFDAVRNRYLTVWTTFDFPVARPASGQGELTDKMFNRGLQRPVTPTRKEPVANLFGQYSNVLGTPQQLLTFRQSEDLRLFPDLAANPFCGNFLCVFNQGLGFSAQMAEPTSVLALTPGYMLIGDVCVPVPEVTTGPIVEVGHDYLKLEGSAVVDEGGNVEERGFCWSEAPDPVIEGDHLAVGSGPGSFDAKIMGLTPRGNYYVRAYAKYSQGIAYGNELLVLIRPQYRVEFKADGQGQLQGDLIQLVYEDDDCSPVGAEPAAGWYFNGWLNLRAGDNSLSNPLILKAIGSGMTPTAQFRAVNLSVWAKKARAWILEIPYNLIVIDLPGFSGGRPDRILLQRSPSQGEFQTIAAFPASQQIQHADTDIEKSQTYLYRLLLLDQQGQEIGRSLEASPLIE